MTSALSEAARASLRAPSVFNTQPWTWELDGDTLHLHAAGDRRLPATDPDGRLLLVSCGAALHHARTALAATGWAVTVERMPDPRRPGLLASIHLHTRMPANEHARAMAAAIETRRTDRRAFGDREVSADELTRLRRFVEAEGAYLHVLRPDQVPALGISAQIAADAERDDPAYRAELRHWTSRPAGSGDGVPPTTAVAPALRRVPVRDFAPDGIAGLEAGAAVDKGAAYVVLFGTSDRPLDLLRAGEAMSALLLTATADGLATAPISDVVEVEWSRQLLKGLLSGIGEPYLVVRLGYASSDVPVPPTPRRDRP